MEAALIAALLADPALTALVEQRINWNARPQGEGLPAIVLTRVAGRRHYDMGQRIGLTETLVQFDVWAASLSSALAVKAALLAALDSLTAAPFQRCFAESERDSFEPAEGPDEVHFHRASVDVRIWHH